MKGTRPGRHQKRPRARAGLDGRAGCAGAVHRVRYLLFDTIEDFQGSFGPHTEKIMAEIPNYTPVQPVVQISEITL
jgi:hypothetical protein